MAAALLFVKDNAAGLTARARPVFHALYRAGKLRRAGPRRLRRVEAKGMEKVLAARPPADRINLIQRPHQVLRGKAAQRINLNMLIPGFLGCGAKSLAPLRALPLTRRRAGSRILCGRHEPGGAGKAARSPGRNGSAAKPTEAGGEKSGSGRRDELKSKHF